MWVCHFCQQRHGIPACGCASFADNVMVYPVCRCATFVDSVMISVPYSNLSVSEPVSHQCASHTKKQVCVTLLPRALYTARQEMTNSTHANGYTCKKSKNKSWRLQRHANVDTDAPVTSNTTSQGWQQIWGKNIQITFTWPCQHTHTKRRIQRAIWTFLLLCQTLNSLLWVDGH